MSDHRLPSHAELDAITIEELRARGSGEKWTRFPDCIAAFVAEMDFGTAPAVEQALRDAIDRSAFGYLPDPLAGELAQSCAELYRSQWGWSPPAAWIRPIADVIKGAEIAIRLFSPPGSKVILPTPIYMPFVGLPATLGRESIQVPMLPGESADGSRVWELDFDGIDRAFADGGHTLILCNPSNPTGRVFKAPELERLADIVESRGGRVFSDEIHAPLTFPEQTHLPYASLTEATAAHTLTAFSASKAWNVPGLKCAQLLISSESDLAIWERDKGFLGYGASTLGVTANTAAFQHGGPWLAHILGYLDENRRALKRMIESEAPQVEVTSPQGTYLSWLDLRRTRLGSSGRALAPAIRRAAGVAVTEGAECGEAGRGFVRFNFALPRPVLERAAKALATATHDAA